jgi:hypothetical protein
MGNQNLCSRRVSMALMGAPLLLWLSGCGGGGGGSTRGGTVGTVGTSGNGGSGGSGGSGGTGSVGGLTQTPTGETLDTHAVLVDAGGQLMSWVTPQDHAYARVSFLSWDLLLNRMPLDPANGLKVYFTHSEYDPSTLAGSSWPNNPAGKNAMLAESAALYYAYSGNGAVIDLVRALLDHQLEHGTTPSTHVWARVPWSTAEASSITYGNDTLREGAGVVEPDKVGELGFHGYLRFWQITGDGRYRDAAIACADALVMNLRSGTAERSPWPFRVNAQSGASIEDYGSHVIAPIRLFDELIRLDLGNVAGYSAAREAAWAWLMSFPMVNGRWTQYFEDVPPGSDLFSNANQYVPGQTARTCSSTPGVMPTGRPSRPR